MEAPRAVDLFSGGGGGWCLALRALGGRAIGLEWDAPSCATRAVVGLTTIRTDVATYPAERFAGKVDGVMGSPPCQSFSSAGKRAGLSDPRGQLIYEPMRYVRAIRPRWVALEQVPEVLGYWRWIAREMATMGYSTWAGILNAADYGVPQIRKRAILLASLDRQAVPPAPTHSKHGAGDLFGAQLPKWVTMAEALGWDGRRHRRELRTLSESRSCTNNFTSATGGGIQKYKRGTDRPSPSVTTRGDLWKLDTRRDQRPDGSTQTVDLDVPAPSVTAKSGGQWLLREHNRDETSIPVEPWELGVLQGFPADHPWQPPRVSAQIGNAIPPPLALACLRSLLTVSAPR